MGDARIGWEEKNLVCCEVICVYEECSNLKLCWRRGFRIFSLHTKKMIAQAPTCVIKKDIEKKGAFFMPKKRSALGGGLEAMFGAEEDTVNVGKTEENVSRETLVKLTDIDPNKSQPRSHFDEDTLQELADSIRQYGIIQPLIVQKKGRRFEIIAGERRWRAARLAGLREVPVLVKEYAPEEIFAVALIENIQRQDLNPIEEATAYQRLIQEYNLKQDEVAEKVAKNRVTITNSMRLLKLDTRVQQMLIDEKISGGHARALLPITDAEVQVVTAIKVFDERLSVRETEKLVKKIVEGNPKSNPEKQQEQLQHQAIYRELEERMKVIFGTKVEIKNKSNNKGKIEIEYYSAAELERLIDMIQKIDPNNG